MDEKRLVHLARKDKRVLEKLLQANYKLVYGYLLKLTCDVELSKDLTQDTMVKAIVYLDSFKGESKFSTWLITIASNIFKNHMKKKKHVTVLLEKDLKDMFDLEDQVINHQRFIKVMTHLKTMKEKQAMPFILKHYYGYSYEEIAEILACPIGTIRSRIHNTIKKLQEVV